MRLTGVGRKGLKIGRKVALPMCNKTHQVRGQKVKGQGHQGSTNADTGSVSYLPKGPFFSISTFQRLLVFVCLLLSVSKSLLQTCSATVRLTKHFIIRFLTLFVNNFFLFWNSLVAISILLRISFSSQYQFADIRLPKYRIWNNPLVPLSLRYSVMILILLVLLRLMYVTLVFFTLIFMLYMYLCDCVHVIH